MSANLLGWIVMGAYVVCAIAFVIHCIRSDREFDRKMREAEERWYG